MCPGRASLKIKTRPVYDNCPVSFVKRHPSARSQSTNGYQDETTATTTKLFFPSAMDVYHVVRKINMDSNLAQILTGHCAFGAYLHRFRRRSNPVCECDGVAEQTGIHLLVECPMYGTERINLELKLGIKLTTGKMRYLISNKETFVDYTKELVKKVIKRNKNIWIYKRDCTHI